MFEESIWASMNSWFTPTVLFVLLNLMIGTIAITSSLASQKHHNNSNNHPQQSHLERSPSVLQRLKSINFYSYTSQQPTTNYFPDNPPQTHHDNPTFFRSPSVLHRLKSITRYNSPAPDPDPQRIHADADAESGSADEAQSIDEIYSQLKGGVSRSKSDTKPRGADPAPPKLARKMKKSASAKSAFAHFEQAETVEARRPATVREASTRATEEEEEGDDEEVDAKADDFINKFKHQLKLQRLDSIIRYKEMIGRGGGK